MVATVLTHVAALSLSSDGRIADEAWRAAAAADRANAVRTLTPRIGKVTLKPHVIVAIMARVIRNAAPARAQVVIKDFEQAGIGEPDARKHFNAALALARTLEPAIDSAVELV